MNSFVSNYGALSSPPFPIIFVIPSGIGCAVGGYAGDAIPAARLLAAASGCLVTHPNVMNGASLYWDDSRIQYVEGYSLGRFALGEIYLKFVRQNKIGLLFDAGIENELIQRHMHVLNSCRASLGLNIGPVIKTDKAIGIQLKKGLKGTSWGELERPDELLKAGISLKEANVDAIAVVTRFPDELEKGDLQNYQNGEGVDPIAGAEAVISHLLSKHLSLPVAHTPALSQLKMPSKLDPRAAAEELGHTFLSCVLVGLNRAPKIVPKQGKFLDCAIESSTFLDITQIGAMVVPSTSLGGEVVLTCVERGIPIIAVDNPSVINVDINSLGLLNDANGFNKLNILHASNYIEAAGLTLLMREGINIDSLCRPLSEIVLKD